MFSSILSLFSASPTSSINALLCLKLENLALIELIAKLHRICRDFLKNFHIKFCFTTRRCSRPYIQLYHLSQPSRLARSVIIWIEPIAKKREKKCMTTRKFFSRSLLYSGFSFQNRGKNQITNWTLEEVAIKSISQKRIKKLLSFEYKSVAERT